MRLIDTMPFDVESMYIPDGSEDYKQGYIEGALHVLEEMDEAPTIDAVPVVHGRWMRLSFDHTKLIPVPWDDMNEGCPERSCLCSVCGDWLTGSDEYPAKGLYCPNCGAKMDLDEE